MWGFVSYLVLQESRGKVSKNFGDKSFRHRMNTSLRLKLRLGKQMDANL